MTNIAITGAKGVIGTALSEQLGGTYDIIPVDLPEMDILDEYRLFQTLKAAEVVIHLAGVFKPRSERGENCFSPYKDPINARLFAAVGVQTRAASREGKLKQFIHASSVHTEDTLTFLQQHPGRVLQAEPGRFVTNPSSGYGKSKRRQEAIVEYTLAPMLENGAVSIRLGGVTASNLPLRQHRRPEVLDHEQRVWLAHEDLGRLIENIIEKPRLGAYDVMYAVSDNDGRFHDTSNKFGWQPQANSANYVLGEVYE